MNTHYLKTVQPYFDEVESGKKTFEVRIDDRTPRYEAGDVAVLELYHPDNETVPARSIQKRITYVLRDKRFVREGYCVFGLEDLSAATAASANLSETITVVTFGIQQILDICDAYHDRKCDGCPFFYDDDSYCGIDYKLLQSARKEILRISNLL